MNISFAWTSPAFIARRKTCTRRDWTADYALKFLPDTRCVAYNRSPRNGGKPIGDLRIVELTCETTAIIPDSDWEAEGFAYLESIGAKCGKLTPRQLWDQWHDDPITLYVVRFDIISVSIPTTGELFA